MARDGAGTYTFPVNSFNPAVAATDISPTDWNSTTSDLATAMSASIAKDGQTVTTAAIPFASGLQTDTISEKTAAAGVTIDGVLLKDGAGTINTRNSTNSQRTALTVLNGNAGGTGSNPLSTQMTDSVGTSATTILSAPSRATLVLVSGTDGSNYFADLLLVTPNSVNVVSQLTDTGSPPARTYSVASFSLKLAMASSASNINVVALGADSRS